MFELVVGQQGHNHMFAGHRPSSSIEHDGFLGRNRTFSDIGFVMSVARCCETCQENDPSIMSCDHSDARTTLAKKLKHCSGGRRRHHHVMTSCMARQHGLNQLIDDSTCMVVMRCNIIIFEINNGIKTRPQTCPKALPTIESLIY